MVNKSLFRSHTLETQTVTVQTFAGDVFFFNFHRTVQTQIIFRVVQISAWEITQTKTTEPVDYIDGKLEQFSRLEFAFQLLSHNQYKLWGKIFKFGDCFSFFFIFIEHSNTNYFSSCTTKASVCETTQTKTNTLTRKLSILYLTAWILFTSRSLPFSSFHLHRV